MSVKRRKATAKRRSSKKPRISACMMVKDEEEMLPGCLESIKDAVDEIVVVDTGSSDQTVEIAKRYGAKVYHHAWEHDFSKHRNQSISYATSEWILIMDADEECFAEDAKRLKEVIRRSNADYIYLQCHDMEKTGKPHGVFNQVRLFRNHAGMHYAGCVHNQLQVIGTGFYSKLRFRHYGYDLDPVRMEEKHERTTSLLLKNIAEDPEDPFNHFQLASSYSMHRDYHKAIETGEIALRLMEEKDLRNAYFSTAYYTVAQAHFALGNLAKAEEICHEAIGFFPLDLNAHHLLAAIHFKNGDLPECRETSLRYLDILQRFEEDPAEMRGVYFNSYGKQHEIYYGLAFTSFAAQAFERAEEYFNRAFELQGKPKEKALEIAGFYLNEKMERKALEWMQRAWEGGFRDISVLKSFIRCSVSRLGPIETRKALEQTAGSFSSWPEYWSLVGDLFREEKDLEAAIRCYKRCVHAKRPEPEVFMKLGLCYEHLGDLTNAINAWEQYLINPSRAEPDLLKMASLHLRRGDLKGAAHWLKQIAGHDLDAQQKHEKTMLELMTTWGLGDIDEFLVRLAPMMKALGLNAEVTLDSSVQLGRILYDVAEKFFMNEYWKLAESALSLALAIAPEAFPTERFHSLLSSQPRI